MEDLYWEHEQHIKGKDGKTVPFWRNMKTCSSCFSEHKKIADKVGSKDGVLSGRGWNYDYDDYKII